jgi:hypothetical protein
VVANILPDKLEVDVKHTISRIKRVIIEPKTIEHTSHMLPKDAQLGTDSSDINSLAAETISGL